MKKLFLLLMLVAFTAGAAHGQLVTTIYDINQGLVPENTMVFVDNIVVTAVASYGFYCQEETSGEYSGIWAYTSSGNPPTVVIGDLVNLTGEYYEYYEYAEIDLSVAGADIEVVGEGQVPDPIFVRAWQVKTANPVEAEKWESVLVYDENLNPLSLDPGYGAYFAEEYDYAVNDTLRLDDQFGTAQPDPGALLASATGVVRYTYDEFCVNPRGNYDLVFDGAAPAPHLDWAIATGTNTVRVRFDREVEPTSAQTTSNYMLNAGLMVSSAVLDTGDPQIVDLTLTTDMPLETLISMLVFNVRNTDDVPMPPQNIDFWGNINSVIFASTPDAGADSSAIADSYVTITGIVHAKYDGHDKSHIYLGDLSGAGDYSGIEVYMNASLDDVEVGDIVIIGDWIYEYYSMTSLAEPFYYFEVVSSGNPVPAPRVMSIDGGDYEVHEGALVEVQDVVVVERGCDFNFYDWSVTQDDLNWLKIDSVNHYYGDMGDFYSYTEGLGDTLNIRGVIRYEYGEYLLMPRSDDDIDVLYQNPTGVEITPGAKVALGQNFPNPFNPTTKIDFALTDGGRATLEIFDVQGRLVKTLVSGVLDAGTHTATWQGDTDTGDAATSGMYFYRLSTPGETMTRRMMLLK